MARNMTLKEWRKNEGLTQKQCGDRLGYTLVTINRWENLPQRTIKGDNIMDIFIKTDGLVDANALFGITPELIDEMEKLRQKKTASKKA